jgi:O-antigen/teichoic acid export membrane protein
MFVFSSWELIGNVSFNLYSQGQNIFVNRFLGTIVNAAVGVAGQVQSLLYMFFSNVTTAFRPQIIKETAAGHYYRAISLVEMGTKFTSLLAVISTVPFFFHLDFLMSIWLEQVPEGAVPICQIFLIANFLNSFNPFVYIAIQATGRNKKINVNMSFVYMIVLLVMYYIISTYKVYIYYYMCGLIIPPISNLLYLICLRKHMPLFSARRFLVKVYLPFSLLFCICMVASWGGCMLVKSHLLSFVLSIFFVGVISSSFTFYMILNNNERIVFKKSIIKIVKGLKSSDL